MPGLAPLTRVAVPSFSIASRAARAAGLPVPAASAMTATALPGLAASAAWTAAAGLSAAGAVLGAGAGSVAACAVLGAVSGAFFVRAIFVTPFHFRRQLNLPASGYFWTTIALHRI